MARTDSTSLLTRKRVGQALTLALGVLTGAIVGGRLFPDTAEETMTMPGSGAADGIAARTTTPTAPRSPRRGADVRPAFQWQQPMPDRRTIEKSTALVDLREAIWWQLWDTRGDVARDCATHTSQPTLCWYRVSAVLTEDRAEVAGQEHVECRYRDVGDSIPDPELASVRECLVSGLAGRIDDVIVPEATAEALRGFRGNIDVELRLQPHPGKAPRQERPDSR